MPGEREELEIRRRLAQGGLSEREELQLRRQLTEGARPPADTILQAFNRGLMNTIALPTDLVSGIGNIINRGDELLGGNPNRTRFNEAAPFRAAAQEAGFVAEEPSEGMGHRAAEIAGAASLPLAATLRAGQAGLTAASQAGRNIGAEVAAPESLLAAPARAPATAAMAELAASGTSAAGGEAVRMFSDDPAMIALGEIAGGFFLPVAAGVTSRLPGVRLAGRAAAATVVPFTRVGGFQRASRRLQSLAAEPQAAADAIRAGGDLSPARLAGDRRLLALEQTVLSRDPEMEARFSDDLHAAMERARQEALDFGGDAARPREVLQRGRDHLLNLLRIRATQASERAQAEISQLGSEATPREISAIARRELDNALTDARTQEKDLWNALPKNVETPIDNATATFEAELAARGRFADPEDIPQWLRTTFQIDDEGKVGLDEPLALVDVQDIRSRVLQESRAERAKDAPNANKLRILRNLQEALLEDMGTVDSAGVQSALAYSRELNEKFTQGAVGRLLGYERAGAGSVDPRDMLDRLLQGTSGTNLDQFLRASPNAQRDLERFIGQRYIEQVIQPGFTSRAHDAFLRRYSKSGVWEQLPELRRELLSAGRSQSEAQRLEARVGRATAAAGSKARSRTGLYLEAPIGQEMARVFRSQNPQRTAATLRRRVQNDPLAVQGLKQQYVEELFSTSETSQFDPQGTPIISGVRLQNQFSKHRDVARALGFTEAEMARMNRTVQTMRRIELKPAKGDDKIISDTPALVLDLAARVIGSHSGQHLASGGMGSSLVLAQFGSQRMRGFLDRLVGDKARQLIVDAQSDRKLYAALLTRSTDPVRKQDEAARTLNAWLIGTQASEDR